MEYIYAALLLNKSGKDVNETNLKKVVEAVGVQPDESKIKSLIVSLEGVDIAKEIENTSFAPSSNVSSAPKEEKKKEKPKEEKKELAAEGLAALFG